jgi:GAF domain-containing protein
VPYVRCASCGLTTFAVRSRAWAPVCPGCDEVLADPVAAEAADRDTVDATLELARQVLAMDVAMVSEIDEANEVARYVSGEWPGVGRLVGASLPLEETFCKRMLEGAIGNAVPDVASDERVRDLQFAKALGVGSWIGVPLSPSLGRLYVLCCLARESRQLDERDVHVLRGFAATLDSRLG